MKKQNKLLTKMPTFAAVAAIGLIGLGEAVQAQTGSRVGAEAQPQTTLWLKAPSDIGKMRKLLREGRPDEAIELAEKFLATVHLPSPYRYSGLNALCIGHTMKGEIEAAIEACNRAITMMPSKWEALNSRATAHYTAGRYQAAIEDYRKALALAPGLDVLQHNLELAEGRLSGS
ncbi:MAG: tetratricopeptide repeat protein [Sphingomonadales bacterium]|nr:tetratricopeptide repeat protein [Sphingomonadales bacterium]